MIVSIILSLHTALYDINEMSFSHTTWEGILLGVIYAVFSMRTLVLRKTFKEKKEKDDNETIAWWRYVLATLLTLQLVSLLFSQMEKSIFVSVIVLFIGISLITALVIKWKNYKLSIFKRGERLGRKSKK